MRRYKEGFLLPMGVVFIFIILIVGMGILYLGTLERISMKKRLNREKAFYLAEAGAYRAYAHLKENINWVPESTELQLGDGTFIVNLSNINNQRVIRSTGNVRGITEQVELYLEGGGQRRTFGNGIFGKTRVYIDGSSQILGYDSRNGTTQDALVGSDLLIQITSTGTIFGDASVASGGQISIPTWRAITDAIRGDITYNAEPRTLNPVSIPSELLNRPYTQYGAPGLSGNYQITSNNFTMSQWPRTASISNGDFKFNNFTLDSDAQLTLNGNVRLYITGNLNLTNNCRFNLASGAKVTIYLGQNANFTIANSAKMNLNGKPSNLAIYSASTNTVNLSGTGDADVYAVVYAPTATVTVANSTRFRGSIVSNTLNLTGNVRVYYDVALSDEDVPGDTGGGSGELTVVKWTKPRWSNRLR
ncbi:MAG: hypothetical protein N3D17_02335 [bacterium]|nr:hypothetical protein [bacterium]